MGDLARKVLYPLVLPFIVLAVWSYAWVMKDESRHAPIFAESPQAPEVMVLPALPVALHQYGFATEDAAFATVGVDEPAE